MYTYEEFDDPYKHFIITPNNGIYQYVNDVWDKEFIIDKSISSEFFSRAIIKNNKILSFLQTIINDFSEKIEIDILPLSLVEYRQNIDVSSYYTINRGTHLDKQNKEFVGLWYFKDTNDIGGMDLYVCKDEYGNEKKFLPYSSNKMILFKNHKNAWHGVTHRNKTNFPRKSIYFFTERKSLGGLTPAQIEYLRSKVHKSYNFNIS